MRRMNKSSDKAPDGEVVVNSDGTTVNEFPPKKLVKRVVKSTSNTPDLKVEASARKHLESILSEEESNDDEDLVSSGAGASLIKNNVERKEASTNSMFFVFFGLCWLVFPYIFEVLYFVCCVYSSLLFFQLLSLCMCWLFCL